MPWLEPALVFVGSASLLLAITFFYVWRSHVRRPHVMLWSLAWLAGAGHVAVTWAALGAPYRHSIWALEELLTATNALLVVAGCSHLVHGRVRRLFLLWLGTPFVAWLALAPWHGTSFAVREIPAALLVGLAYLTAARQFFALHHLRGTRGALFVSGLFGVAGLHELDFPLFGNVAWLAPFGYGLTALLAVGIALSLLIMILEEERSALENSEARLEEAQRVARMGSWHWDASSRALVWSRGLGPILGLAGTSGPLSSLLEHVHPEDRARVDEVLRALPNTPGPFEFQHRVVLEDASERVVSQRGIVWTPQVGGASRIVGTTRDVTEERQVAVRLQEANKLQALGTLAGGIAHDFNNSLMAIVSYAEIIQMTAAPGSDAAEYAERIGVAVSRAGELVRRILSASRREGQEPTAINLAPQVREALELLRAGLPANVELLEPPRLPELWVRARPSDVQHLLVNLGTNAIQAMPEGGRLEVRLERSTLGDGAAARLGLAPGEYAFLAVSDSGHGMGRETLDRAFEPFFTTKDVGKGTGLGLAIVHEIVSSLGGRVELKSTPGAGTSGLIYLPLASEAVAQPAAEAAPVQRGEGERVLLVDDEAEVRESGSKLLEQLGYAVVTCADGQAARAHLGEVDIVITDWAMPGMTGEQLIGIVRSECPGLPVILLSGHMGESPAPPDSRADRVLAKPLSARALAFAVHETLKAARSGSRKSPA